MKLILLAVVFVAIFGFMSTGTDALPPGFAAIFPLAPAPAKKPAPGKKPAQKGIGCKTKILPQ